MSKQHVILTLRLTNRRKAAVAVLIEETRTEVYFSTYPKCGVSQVTAIDNGRMRRRAVTQGNTVTCTSWML